ncbi:MULTISPECIES: hypothetical protein [Geobacillus]|jgi:glucan phosphoethanolaminetransferase (alkaline phosphatase superfamily)|uniref:Uncharacterized protein n=1 Tax=Geobacillus thermodenitrificans TaxID=33940 RepID=A0ABY9Q860_GEOTD|nr:MULTISPECIES: hypothetical protein [Geobacillus]ARA99340.1 hypothetical protein GD3902_15615 [Geobacillus thermodenitrificans]ARP43263.1 hypothetical protein GTHT12_01739 [Geobacillus thermodenitrificans]ATO38643.1 hypothetical protein GTID1_16500 [Geobacillus thermodenitrificans]KQB92860.1 putative membrane protein [Geobacillus sp. PA-3]MED3717150.1 hypothetical protein [Geobacillus thermodenitrificans]
MKAWLVVGMLIIVGLIWWYEWSRLEREYKKEKAAVAILLCLAMLLGVILMVNPDLPGPTQAVDRLFRPFGKMLEK